MKQSIKLLNAIKNKQIISFDIFDTLLLRPYINPNEMFVHLEKIHRADGFAQSRIKAEADYYSKHGTTKEATLDDIYRMLPNFSHMKQIELDWEMQILSINPEIKEIYDYAINQGKKVIICSDMYLPISHIEKLLIKNDIKGYSKIYLSNEINHRKDRGDMYEFIVRDLNVDPKAILHIGDNRKSDYKQAMKHGITSCLYTKTSDVFLTQNIKFKTLLTDLKGCHDISILTAMVSQKPAHHDYWIDFGYKYAGPLAYAYARYIYNTAKEHQIKKVLFIARDGYLIEKIFNTFNYDIKTSYVYAPRIVNYTANLDYNPAYPEQPRIICEYFGKDTGLLSPKDFIEHHMGEFKKLAEREKQEIGYSKYIKNIIGDEKLVGTVDTISGNLSGQSLIEKEAGVKTCGLYILTFSQHQRLHELEHNDYFKGREKDLFSKDNKCHLTELIFSAPEDPIISFRNGVPIYKDSTPAEMQRQDICKKITIGAMEFANDIKKRFSGNDVYFQSSSILTLLDIYIRKPEKADIKAMLNVSMSPHADNGIYMPLLASSTPFWKTKQLKRLVWLTPLQRLGLLVLRPVKIKMKGFKKIELVLLPYFKKNIFSLSALDAFHFKIGDKS